MAAFTPAEEMAWSEKLLPRSERLDQVLADAMVRDEELEITLARDSMRHILKGVRFKGSSALGPSGCRPEHLQDFLLPDY